MHRIGARVVILVVCYYQLLVVLITKQIWDNFFLNWHWIFKSKLFDGTANLLAHA
jgi:hypothetical protein